MSPFISSADLRQRGGSLFPTGRPKGKDAPSGGSKRNARSVGARLFPLGRPKGKDAPSGGSKRNARSVGAHPLTSRGA
ncbi:hypothetical protein J2732_004423 [Achromobacter deleyi]|nr:hypothetical protein [Achromobacter deleyi]